MGNRSMFNREHDPMTTLDSICKSSDSIAEALARVSGFLMRNPNPAPREPGERYQVRTLGDLAKIPDVARADMMEDLAPVMKRATGIFFRISIDEGEWTDDGLRSATTQVTLEFRVKTWARKIK